MALAHQISGLKELLGRDSSIPVEYCPSFGGKVGEGFQSLISEAEEGTLFTAF